MKETELVEGLLDIFSLESYPYPADDLTQALTGKRKRENAEVRIWANKMYHH